MSSVNAPQPDATGPAEVFDSTVGPSQGQTSVVQGPGASPQEVTQHVGQANMIDPFFFIQFIALTSFIWDISMSPGQLLWRIPIHPFFVHQFMAHLAKMYNTYGGGFIFSFTIAGTGFHAGKLMIARLPPNIKPESLRTVQDISAFPYFIMDPKTLETEVRSAMDQRNIMYHWLKFDEDDPQSFGGFLACYVMLPLATSATGQSQISVQVLTKCDPQFTFAQIRPIDQERVNLFKPDDIEFALDFTQEKTNSMFLSKLKSMKIAPGKEIKELGPEMSNAAQGNGNPFLPEFYPRFEAMNIYRRGDFDDIFSTKMEVAAGDVSGQVFKLTGNAFFSYEHLGTGDGAASVSHYPNMTCDEVLMSFITGGTSETRTFTSGNSAKIRKRTEKDDSKTKTNVIEYENDGWSMTYSTTTTIIDNGYVDELFDKGALNMLLSFNKPPNFDVKYTPVAPPIKESIIVFESENGDCAQPHELTEVLRTGKYAGVFQPNLSLVFELIDKKVNLPLLPVRLHFKGYFSTTVVDKEVIFSLENPTRYFLRFVGLLPETTAMVGSHLPIATQPQYVMNRALSRVSNLQG